ncbi:MAG: hypothetical protein Q9168_006176 [Polycauliona sp. 1 TL-2023]
MLFCIVLFLHHASALFVPVRPNAAPNGLFASTADSAITQNVAGILRVLAASPDIKLREAKLRAVHVTTANPDKTGYPLPQRSNLDLFHFIVLTLSAGGPVPTGAHRDWIYLTNDFPDNWQQWNEPRINPYNLPEQYYPAEIHWDQVSVQMSVGRAEELMRAAGYRDTFAKVDLWELDGGAGQLSWTFDYYGGSDTQAVFVNVVTGAVISRAGPPLWRMNSVFGMKNPAGIDGDGK